MWIDSPFETIWSRREFLARERPLLGTESEMRALYAARQEFYGLADLRISASGKSPEMLVDDAMMGMDKEFMR